MAGILDFLAAFNPAAYQGAQPGAGILAQNPMWQNQTQFPNSGMEAAPVPPAPVPAATMMADQPQLPANAQPAQAPMPMAPQDGGKSLLQSLTSGTPLSGIGDWAAGNRNTLLALAAGFAGAPSFGDGMRRAFSNAQAGSYMDTALGNQAAAKTRNAAEQNQTYQWLVSQRGMDPNQALAMLSNKEALGAYWKEALAPAKPDWSVIGYDQFGTPQYGWVNPRAQTVTPGPEVGMGEQTGDSTVPPVPAGMDPKVWRSTITKAQADALSPAGPEVASSLRKEIQGLPSYKNLSQAAPIYQSMVETAGRDSRASDLNLVYGLGKIMDPGSVVREGEMVMVKNTASLPDWLIGSINSLNGGAGLTPGTREAIMKEAYSRMQSYEGLFNNDVGQYRGIVDRRGMNAADVIPQFGKAAPWQRPDAGQQQVPAGATVRQNGRTFQKQPDGKFREVQ